MRCRTTIESIALSTLLALCACSGDKGDPGEPGTGGQNGKGAAKPAQPAKPAKPSVRPTLEPWRSLLDEAGRAELALDGLFIDFGTADQHKYTRGGWRTGWGDNRQTDKVTVGEAVSQKTVLDVVAHEPVAEIVVRARSSAAGQKTTVYAGGTALASPALTAEWSLLRVPVKEPLEPGRHGMSLRFTKKASDGPVAEIDWMWLARTAGSKPPTAATLRVLPVPMGGQPKRALVAPTPRTFSFYLQPPEAASLVFDYGSDAGATFTVTARTDGGSAEQLFTAKGEDAWNEAQVDLSAYAGKAVRLDLAITGASGKSGWGEPALMVPPDRGPGSAEGVPSPGAEKPDNVIVILIDTVRADVFEPFAPGNKIKTPTYDQLARQSTVFVNAYNNENWTKPSVATTLSGLYPTTHDTKKDGSELPREVRLLSQQLQGDGFATAGFVANGYVSEKFGFEKGWDTFKNYIRISQPSEAEHVYKDGLEWLDKGRDKSKPFFLYLQTIDPHVVYKVDPPYTGLYFTGEYQGPLGPTIAADEQVALSQGKLKGSQTDIDWLRALYYGEVTYHDEHMGKFLAAIEAMGLLDNTLLVVTNDHGEELGDHGKYGHGHSLYDHMLRAPLMMHYPPIFAAGRRIDEVVENVDVSPTILEVLGRSPMKGIDGQSLLPLVEGKPGKRPYYAISEFLEGRRAIRVGSWRFLRSSSTWTHLYNVVADPAEKENRIDDSPIARRMCEIHLGEGLAVPDKSKRLQDIAVKRKFTAGQAQIDPQMRRQLEALGYFGDDAKKDEPAE